MAGWPGDQSRRSLRIRICHGHSEIKKWKDPRTTSRYMLTTYRYGFNYGQLQAWNPDIQWMEERTCAREVPR